MKTGTGLGGRLHRHLESAGVAFERIPHPPARDAGEVARVSHVRARRLARSEVVVNERGEAMLLVLPASERLDLRVARRVTGAVRLEMASDAEKARVFPDCDPRCVPPFGPIYGLPAVLDLCLFEEEEDEGNGEIFFESGDPGELIAMRFPDYRRAAGPFLHEACLHARPLPLHPVKHGGRGALD